MGILWDREGDFVKNNFCRIFPPKLFRTRKNGPCSASSLAHPVTSKYLFGNHENHLKII